MTRRKRTIQKATVAWGDTDPPVFSQAWHANLERFENLVREECAKLTDDMGSKGHDWQSISAAIRAGIST